MFDKLIHNFQNLLAKRQTELAGKERRDPNKTKTCIFDISFGSELTVAGIHM
jgi:hypothetical protein